MARIGTWNTCGSTNACELHIEIRCGEASECKKKEEKKKEKSAKQREENWMNYSFEASCSFAGKEKKEKKKFIRHAITYIGVRRDLATIWFIDFGRCVCVQARARHRSRFYISSIDLSGKIQFNFGIRL